jgi:anti-sigma regulatory factor (Ser/Thr protein kinase)
MGISLLVSRLAAWMRALISRRSRGVSLEVADHGHPVNVPTSGIVISQRFPCAADQIAKARRFVADLLGDDHPSQEIAILLTSEVATNAIRHGSGEEAAAASFLISVLHDEARVVVAVFDSGSRSIPYLRSVGLDATGGRGIGLVDELGIRWGFTRHSSKEGTGFWFEVGPHDPVQDGVRCICPLLSSGCMPTLS